MNYIKTKKHPDYDNYLIDENGYIYSKINGYDNGTGYRLYKLTNNDGSKNQVLGHRITYEAWNEQSILPGMDIHHKNHIRDCNHINNLEEVTRSNNLKASYIFRKKNKK
jgi:hypothetical protein